MRYRQRFVHLMFVILAVCTTATFLSAQDTSSVRGVRLGLTYGAGSKPGIIVLNVDDAPGDSVRVILQRDFDFSDRLTPIMLDANALRGLQPKAPGKFNYPLIAKFGAVGIVQASPIANGYRVSLYDVAAKKQVNSADFAVTAERDSREWRQQIHGISDEVERWITGRRGIAQTRVAFVRGNFIYIVDSDGAMQQQVTTSGRAMSPAWHPSGEGIVYSAFGSRGTQIVMRNLGSDQAEWKRATPTGLNITPVFSRDGKFIVYAHGSEIGTDLYIANSDDNLPARQLTVGRGTDNTSPAFSPDGRRIAFMSGRSGHPEVYIMDSDGTNPELLTGYTYGESSWRASPDWSPDGRIVAYQSQIGGRFQIMTINVRDRSVKQHTSEGENEDPSWAPDSRHVVFTSSRSGFKQLWVLDVESGRARQLTHSSGARLASWSPSLSSNNISITQR